MSDHLMTLKAAQRLLVRISTRAFVTDELALHVAGTHLKNIGPTLSRGYSGLLFALELARRSDLVDSEELLGLITGLTSLSVRELSPQAFEFLRRVCRSSQRRLKKIRLGEVEMQKSH